MTPRPTNVHHLRDPETGRKFPVEYLLGNEGKYGRVRGRVALVLADLPPAMRKLARVRPDGGFENVYARPLRTKQLVCDDERRAAWYQPMFKQRTTRADPGGAPQRGVEWYSSLGGYWEPAVAAVAAALAKQRHAAGMPREVIERVEEDLLQAARDCAAARMAAAAARRQKK